MRHEPVLVSGLGVVSSLGWGMAENAQALAAGRSGVVAVPAWNELGMPVQIAGLIPATSPFLAASKIPATAVPRHGPAGHYALVACEEALAAARLTREHLASERTGCVVGIGLNDADAIVAIDRCCRQGSARQGDPNTIVRSMGSAAAAAVAVQHSLGGPSLAVSSACATGNHAVAVATDLIRAGRCDVVLAGAAEAITVAMAGGFMAMRMTLTSRHNADPEAGSRPFSADRDGFVISGGAGILVLESASHAARRGFEPDLEILGTGMTSDGKDMVLPLADGARSSRAMRLALDDAGLNPLAIDLVKAHATSTRLGDLAEATAIRTVFGANPPPITAPKSLTGHGLGAAGAQELAYAAAMIRGSFIAPIRNLAQPGPEFAGLDLVATARQATIGRVACNSFGFGGTNAVVILGRRR
jgi:3-oxoacyl-[acyl-carrier-protein] synthase-1